MKSLTVIFLLILTFVCSDCSVKADLIDRIERAKEVFSVEDEKDLPGRFIGKETGSNWKIDTIEAKNIDVINGLFFTDDNNGWLIGAFNLIYRTTDGGKNWEKISVKIPEKTAVSNVFFADANNGWMIVSRYNISILEAEKNKFWIMKTTDGGKTWKPTYTSGASVVGQMKFADAKTGYVTGYRYTGVNKKPIESESFFLKTVDGGENWTDLSKAFNDFSTAKSKENRMQYTNDFAENLYFFSPEHIRATTRSRRILETKDGGLNWSKIGEYAHDDAQVGIKNFGYKEDGTGWYLESTYSIEGVRSRLKTKNSQNQIARRIIHGVYFGSAFYLSGNSFIAAGREGDLTKDGDVGVIWLTKDDGQTWSEIYRNEKIKGIGSMVQTSKNSFWMLCENKEILHLYQN